MSNLRSDARRFVRVEYPEGDLARTYIERLAHQVDDVEERWQKAERRTLRRFQDLNGQRCVEAFDHELDAWTLLEWSGALAGEVGELCNVAKKLSRKRAGIGGAWAARDPDERELLAQLEDEAGDVLAYLALLADAAGFDLWKAAASKFDRISTAAGWNGPRMLDDPRPTVRLED